MTLPPSTDNRVVCAPEYVDSAQPPTNVGCIGSGCKEYTANRFSAAPTYIRSPAIWKSPTELIVGSGTLLPPSTTIGTGEAGLLMSYGTSLEPARSTYA